MGRPFDILELKKDSNKFNILLSKIGLTFFVVYTNYSILGNNKIRLLINKTYKSKNIISRIKNVIRFDSNDTKTVLMYTLKTDSNQRLKNKMGLRLKQIKKLARNALKKYDYDKHKNNSLLVIKKKRI